jgi:hypothetical protein
MIKRLLPCLLLLAFILPSKFAKAQNAVNSIEVSPIYGLKMFTADSTLKGSTWGVQVVYHINMANNKADWVKMLNIRTVDLAFSFRDYQNVYLSGQPTTSIGFLGNYYGAVARVGIELAHAGKTEFLLTPGFGFGYAGQSYYTNDNPLVGSHINFTAQVGLKVLTPLSLSTRLVAGVDVYHYSNAAFKLPNYGVNSINATIGIDQDINTPAPQTAKKVTTGYKKGTFEVGVDIGRRGLVQDGGVFIQHPEYKDYQKNATSELYQSGVYLGYNYRLSQVFSVRGGLDGVYYYKTLDTLSDLHHFYATYQELGSSYDRWRVGASIGAEIWLGRFSLPVNYGYYIHYHYFVPTYDHTYEAPNNYWTFGARYALNRWLTLEAKQYLHRTQADFAGFGVIFRL